MKQFCFESHYSAVNYDITRTTICWKNLRRQYYLPTYIRFQLFARLIFISIMILIEITSDSQSAKK